ncbi:MAG: two-component system nitrogen regulation sensor histidine kinase GlnL [Pseudorhodobacter sp.]|jgi:two-component system nitrogen regulation sensor histidine kinase GlnL
MSPQTVPSLTGVVWASLPIPGLLIDGQGLIVDINPAAEDFLNVSTRSLKGQFVFDRLHINAPMEEAIARTRFNRAALSINDVDVTTGEKPPVQCQLQLAPIQDNPDYVMLLIWPREIADRFGRDAGT